MNFEDLHTERTQQELVDQSVHMNRDKLLIVY